MTEVLSPTDLAAQQLAAQLSNKDIDAKGIKSIFHLGTDDYGIASQTIEIACGKYANKKENFKIMSANDFMSAVQTDDKQKNGFDFERVYVKTSLNDKSWLFVIINFYELFDTSGKQTFGKYFQMAAEYIQRCEKLRYEGRNINDYSASIFFVSYGPNMWPTVLSEKIFSVDYPALCSDDFKKIIEEHLKRQKKSEKEIESELKSIDIKWYYNMMTGLSEMCTRSLFDEMRSVFAKNEIDFHNKRLVENVIISYKNKLLAQHDRLKIVEREEEPIQGMERVSDWLAKHGSRLDEGKSKITGMLMVGIPGTGKSATAHMAANVFNLPLVRLEMSKILGGYVGDSEKGMAEAFSDLKMAAPCILWIDEIEKALSGADGNDGNGVVQRLFGMLLSFMQENHRPVFTVATANDISKLPPELFRNGRFDVKFCAMMPSYDGCTQIMKAKLNKYKSPECETVFNNADSRKIFNECIGDSQKPRFLTGADIEAHVKELFWRVGYEKKEDGTSYDASNVDDLALLMKITASTVPTQASADSPDSMLKIAKSYLEMMLRGMVMAGDEETPYLKSNLNLDRVRFFKYRHEVTHSLDSCLKPDGYKDYDKMINSTYPEEWYDAVMYKMIGEYMTEVVIRDESLTLPQTRQEYWEYKTEQVINNKEI